MFLASLHHAGGQKDQFANNLKSCVASNPDINVCLLKTLEDLRSLMPIGIPELNLRPTEPFQINNLKFKTRPGLGISIDSTFTDVTVKGLSTFVTNYIKAELDTRNLLISLTVPKINIWGNYQVAGNVFLLNVEGNGPFQATLEGVTGVGSASIVPVGPAGNQKLSILNTNIDFDIRVANVRLENLFDGKLPALADTVNEFINKNSQLIINEVKPQIREEVTKLVESVMNDAFSKLPADDFLEKLPPAGPSSRSIPKVRSRSILFGRR